MANFLYYDLQDAVARIDEARANLGITRSNQLPQFSASGAVEITRLSRDGQFPLLRSAGCGSADRRGASEPRHHALQSVASIQRIGRGGDHPPLPRWPISSTTICRMR